MRRLLPGVLLLVLLLPGVAFAHGGSVVAAGGNAAYRLTVQAADTKLKDGGNAVDLTAYPVRLSNGVTDLTADVRITIDGGETLRPEVVGDGFEALDGGETLRPDVVGDGFEALVPIEKRGAWRTWTVRAALDCVWIGRADVDASRRPPPTGGGTAGKRPASLSGCRCRVCGRRSGPSRPARRSPSSTSSQASWCSCCSARERSPCGDAGSSHSARRQGRRQTGATAMASGA